jgi:hypothetical protein
MDISGTVAKMAMEYIKPEYPIYKMKIFTCEDGMGEFTQRTFILEHNDKAFRSHYIEQHDKDDLNFRIEFDDAIIHTDFLNKLKEDENLSWFDGFGSKIHGVIYCKRIA